MYRRRSSTSWPPGRGCSGSGRWSPGRSSGPVTTPGKWCPVVPITLPDVGADAVLSVWYVRPGEPMYEGDRVAEVLLPGVTVDVHAPASGTLAARIAHPGDRVCPGDVLGTIHPSG